MTKKFLIFFIFLLNSCQNPNQVYKNTTDNLKNMNITTEQKLILK